MKARMWETRKCKAEKGRRMSTRRRRNDGEEVACDQERKRKEGGQERRKIDMTAGWMTQKMRKN